MWLTLVVAGVRQIVQAQGGASGEGDRLFHSLRDMLGGHVLSFAIRGELRRNKGILQGPVSVERENARPN